MPTEIMDARRKKQIGAYSFLPLIAWLIATGYHLRAFKQEVAAKRLEDHIALTTETARHWTPLMLLYGAAGVLTLAALLYFIVHLLRVKQMNAASKMGWIAFLIFLSPLSFPLFWYIHIRKEPRQLETYPSI